MGFRDKALEGKVALVTGASRGIGRAIAVALGGRGARVVVNYHSREDAARETAEAIEKAGGQATLSKFDVGAPEAVTAGVQQAADSLGRLDILVNNAGIAIDQLILRAKQEDWQRSLDVNLTAAFVACKAATKYLLKARESGRIINLTSVVGEQGNAGQIVYAAAKAGLIGITKTLARELASRGVTVNAISPGFIDTDMTAASVQGAVKEKLLAQIPLGRMGTPEEIGDLAAFLAGPEGAYVTGQVIRVNGGLLM
jgi:3-oxoacyl-[acyl-carrier protein] reductase